MEQPAEDYKVIKRKWLQQKSEKVETMQSFLLTEVRMFQTDQTSCHLSRKFKGETSKDQHPQTLHSYSAHSRTLLGYYIVKDQ